MTFIDREKELDFLEEKWRELGAQFIVLWGKRRVGKTELVRQFLRNKPHIYFLGESTNEPDQLKRLSQAIGRFFREALLETRGFAGWEEVFQFLKARDERIVLAIDEFPYLVDSNPAVPGLFQKGWDEHLSKGKLFIVLFGSSIAMMESHVLGYKAPLYGRRTGQWRIDPLPFSSASLFRAGRSFEDQLSHFAVAGGIPAYWLQLSPEKDFWKNLEDHVLQKGQVLYDEVEFIMREELREPRYYFALLQAISLGKRKLAEIVNATGIPQPAANKYLAVLADLKVVERELPVTEEMPLKSKKGLYRIVDPFIRFWFRFVFSRRGELEMGRIEEVREGIKRDFPDYLASVYEEAARDILWTESQKPFVFQAIGRWWEKNEEIDLVGLNQGQNSILFGEAKWRAKPVGTQVLEDLKRKAKLVCWGGEPRKNHYALFSRKGFTLDLMKMAKEEGIMLFKEAKLLRF